MSIDPSFLRHSLKSSRTAQMYETALFFSEKLMLISSEYSDIKTHSKLLLKMHKTKELLFFLHKKDLLLDFESLRLNHSPRESLYFNIIAAKCSFEMHDYDQSLIYLNANADKAIDIFPQLNKLKYSQLISSACIQKAKSYEKLENRKCSVKWYIEALIVNPYCVESLDSLVQKNLLSPCEKNHLLNQLKMDSLPAWLSDYYKDYLLSDNNGQQTLKSVENFEKLGLTDSVDCVFLKARIYFSQGQYKQCVALIESAMRNSVGLDIKLGQLLVYSLFAVKDNSALFEFAHKMTENHPEHAFSWFCVGVFYLMKGQAKKSKRFFLKSTKIDPLHGPSWIGFGHVFSKEGVVDQAFKAYSTARRIMPGFYAPDLYIAMNCIMINRLGNAQTHLNCSLTLSKSDPLIFNELGVVHYHLKKYNKALQFFQKALGMVKESSLIFWEPLLFNLGQCWRQLGDYRNALKWYENSLVYTERKCSVLLAIGLTHHISGEVDEASNVYNRILVLNPENKEAGFMLETLTCNEEESEYIN